jgi:dGTPase
MRLLTKRIFTEQHVRTGIKPTRALIDAVCKYKQFWKLGMQNHFLYEDQHDCTEFIHNGLQVTEQSIECQVMDWSDDIANGYANINDGVKARLIDVPALERWASSQTLDAQDSADVNKVIESIKMDDTEKFRARGIGECIKATSVVPRNGAIQPWHRSKARNCEALQTHEEHCEGNSDPVCFGATARDENAPDDEGSVHAPS